MKHSRLLPVSIVLTLALLAPVAPSSGEPTAVAAKKKCTKALWKCAPKRYHLSAHGSFVSSDNNLTWSAEVDLGRRRASAGLVDYSQDGGKVKVSGSATSSVPEDHCILPESSSFTVPEQTMNVPRGAVYGSDFSMTFDLSGSDKNKYGIGFGAPQPEYSNIKGTYTVHCAEGTSHTHEYFYVNTIPLTTAIVRRGRPNGSPLSGTAKDNARSSDEVVSWKLTAKK